MQTENKKKLKISIEEQIRLKEEKLQQEKNQLKQLKKKPSTTPVKNYKINLS